MWRSDINSPKVVWYDSFSDAQSNLFDEGEFVLSSYFKIEKAA